MAAPSGPRPAKPFLKWAGGKTQLLPQIAACFPPELSRGGIHTYVEPFVGSGALFFYLAQTELVQRFILIDSNRELISAYLTLQKQVEPLIDDLTQVEQTYQQLDAAGRRQFFYAVRTAFNQPRPAGGAVPDVTRTAQFIFLNRTCYNGLFRVNRQGAFNVPFGSYKNPQICLPNRLRAAAGCLQKAEIYHADFTFCRPLVGPGVLVYFDPPYRPISPTARFTAYQSLRFDDEAQIRLAHFFVELDRAGARLMLSNSDPRLTDPQDTFFQTLYAGFRINQVFANRMINSQGHKRGKLSELLITNYEPG